MTMAAVGYKTKKELKAAVGQPLRYAETSLFGPEFKPDGNNTVVGPTTYERKWFATVTCRDGVIVKVT